METRLRLSNRPAVRRYAATRELADQGQRAIPFADLDALALVESFGKAVYVAPG
jgi:hypothetical protein